MEAVPPLAAVLALLAAGCASPPPPPPPPGIDTLPPVTLAMDLRGPAARAREAVEEVLGRAVPAEAAEPVVASVAEMEEALAEELRPQVDFLHAAASAAARETLLRATARGSAASVAARYSPRRRRVIVTPVNFLAQMRALGLPEDRPTLRAFATLVLAHEMVHACDDADHDLGTLFASAPDAESLRARGMVAEGRAVHFARRAAERLDLPAAVAAALPVLGDPPDERHARFHLTYGRGAAFVADLERRGGLPLAARALADPPRATSTVFHPERYGPAGEAPPPVDAAAVLRGLGHGGAADAGELDLRARWLPVLGPDAVERAFAGWECGAGLHRPDGGVSVSCHGEPAQASSYAAALLRIYGLPEGEREGDVGGSRVVVETRGRVVATSIHTDPAVARREAAAAAEAVAAALER